MRRLESLEKRQETLEQTIAKEEIIVLREIDRDEAKAEIEQLFAHSEVLYYSDVVKRLHIDLELVVEICQELIKEGKIRIAEGS